MMNLYLMTLIGLVHVAAGIPAPGRGPVLFRSDRLRVLNGWTGGSGDTQYCPGGAKANGFRIKYDNRPGNGDKNGLTGIELVCDTTGTGSAQTVTSNVGREGSWSIGMTECPPDQYLLAFKLRVQDFQGFGDDTSVNNIAFQCSSLHVGDNSGSWIERQDGGQLGEFGEPSSRCADGKAICGMKTIVDQNNIADDKTGLDNVEFYCC